MERGVRGGERFKKEEENLFCIQYNLGDKQV